MILSVSRLCHIKIHKNSRIFTNIKLPRNIIFAILKHFKKRYPVPKPRTNYESCRQSTILQVTVTQCKSQSDSQTRSLSLKSCSHQTNWTELNSSSEHMPSIGTVNFHFKHQSVMWHSHLTHYEHATNICEYYSYHCCLQCFDVVGWAAGRPSGL